MSDSGDSIAGVSLVTLRRAASRSDVITAMTAFYARADALIADQPGTCWNKSECCHFGQFGHRLYVTALEVCYYLAHVSNLDPAAEDSCPHAVGGRCQVRPFRPLGCRIFYCDPKAAGWQGPATEALLDELKALHQRLDVPYFYVDWMAVLSIVMPVTKGIEGPRDRTDQAVFVGRETPRGRRINLPIIQDP